MKRVSPHTLFILGSLLLAFDVVTKWATAFFLPLDSHREIPLFSFLGIDISLTHTTNLGAAWGLFSSFPYILVSLRIIFIAILALYLFKYPTTLRVPLTFLLSGAIGNVLDFFFYGHVIDMVHCVFWGYDYPVFNVADMMITMSVASILILLVMHRRQEV